jgi:hypothetical protein
MCDTVIFIFLGVMSFHPWVLLRAFFFFFLWDWGLNLEQGLYQSIFALVNLGDGGLVNCLLRLTLNFDILLISVT